MASASMQGRVALGARAGRRVLRLGRDPDAPWITSRGPRQAHLDGFDLHADVSAPAGDLARLEHLCRYLLRPPIAQERLALTPHYHGVLAPHAARRELVVAYGSPEPEQLEPSAARRDAPATASKDRRYWAWADLMRRAFEIDVLACPRCGGRMQLIATIEDSSVIRKGGSRRRWT